MLCAAAAAPAVADPPVEAPLSAFKRAGDKTIAELRVAAVFSNSVVVDVPP